MFNKSGNCLISIYLRYPLPVSLNPGQGRSGLKRKKNDVAEEKNAEWEENRIRFAPG